ncbi:MAG: hypothetical protein JJU00_08775 [Opitutales bacterium]|nr:hypothetical protein [Opitutales bacterium]
MTDQPDTAAPLLPDIFLASVALEPNRWKSGDKRRPSLRLGDYAAEAAEAGFAGWELWEDHLFLNGPGELDALVDTALPVRVFNTYAIPGQSAPERLDAVNNAIAALAPALRGVKFNLGPAKDEDADPGAQIEAALRWAERLPEHVRLLCECHPGTVIEEPAAAARAFAAWPRERFGAIVHTFGQPPARLGEWFAALGDRIEHLHIQARDDQRQWSPLAALEPALRAALAELRRQSFSGTAALEFVYGLGRPGESPESLFAQACDDLAALRANGW